MHHRRLIRHADVLIVSAVAAIALAARLAIVLRRGGVADYNGYDVGVYYAAADALVHGRLPYRDFVLLHPPVIMLALSPSAWIGFLTQDRTGFAVANLSFSVIGAVNAGLVTILGRRFGLARRAATAGGLFYAVWLGAAGSEFLARLEPLGNFFLLLGLTALGATPARRSTRALMVGGAALATAASVKIWFAVPLIIVGVWIAATERGHRAVLRFLAGALGAALVIDGPFLVLSHGRMWSMVVTDQLRRPRTTIPMLTRLADLTGVRDLMPSHPLGAVVALAAAVIAAAVLLAWRERALRVFPLLAVAQVAVLVSAPSWFPFYADFAAVPISLCVAAAAAALPHRQRAAGWLPAAAAAAVTVAVAGAGTLPAVARWHDLGRLQAGVAGLHCVMADTPGALIQLDVLDRDLSDGCRNWVDVTGRTFFGRDRPSGPRAENPVWQHDIRSYLTSGEAVIIVRSHGTGLTASTLRALHRDGPLVPDGPQTVYRTRPAPSRHPLAG